MATGEQMNVEISRGCALFFLLLVLTASFSSAQSSTQTGVAKSYTRNNVPATKGSHGSGASAAKNGPEITTTDTLIDGEARPIGDECFEVCCWQGDAHCPYPYCNYNQSPCNGD